MDNKNSVSHNLEKHGQIEHGDFLQSQPWRKFQENTGKKTFQLESEGFSVVLIQHVLPMVGKYFYAPRGPIASLEGEEFPISNSSADEAGFQFPTNGQNPKFKNNIKKGMRDLVELAKKEKAGWIRVEPENEESLEYARDVLEEIRPRRTDYRIVKAPHDMQPREIFVVDISKSAQQLLAEMKSKTRYNIGIAQKKGVVVHAGNKEEYIEAFLKLTKEMAARHGITAHPEQYYLKMIESLPAEMLKIYVAQFEGKIIAANLVLFFGKTATYLHGASGNENRNVMAPFLLQWQAMLDAKELGFEKYDFGGISTNYEPGTNVRITNRNSSWSGITDFKLGFSPQTLPVEFPGSYDIVVNPRKYGAYRILQKLKMIFH